jgi:hypothetical protein
MLLKRAVGDIRDATGEGAPGRAAAARAYNAVKDESQRQALKNSKRTALESL